MGAWHNRIPVPHQVPGGFRAGMNAVRPPPERIVDRSRELAPSYTLMLAERMAGLVPREIDFMGGFDEAPYEINRSRYVLFVYHFVDCVHVARRG